MTAAQSAESDGPLTDDEVFEWISQLVEPDEPTARYTAARVLADMFASQQRRIADLEATVAKLTGGC